MSDYLSRGSVSVVQHLVKDLGPDYRHCVGCGRLFEPERSSQIACTVKCGQNSRRRRHLARLAQTNKGQR